MVFTLFYTIIDMIRFDLHILGCGSALPTTRHNQTSQVLNIREKLFMIDCGEGTQLNFRKAKLKFSRLQAIFISHLHGDHCLGLLGLLSTFSLLGRTNDLKIYSPKGLQEVFGTAFAFFCSDLSYKIEFVEFDHKTSSCIYEDRTLTVETIPLKHRIPCSGFLFREKPLPLNIIKEAIDQYEVPIYEMNRIKNGADFITKEGVLIPNHLLTKPPVPPRSYAYCSDTAYHEPIAEQIKNVNLLFHEATFSHRDVKRAKQTRHSTAKQAAAIASMSKVDQLVIGHFSARYQQEEEQALLLEAKEIFANTCLATEGLTICL